MTSDEYAQTVQDLTRQIIFSKDDIVGKLLGRDAEQRRAIEQQQKTIKILECEVSAQRALNDELRLILVHSKRTVERWETETLSKNKKIEQLRKELELLKQDDAERCALIRDMEEEERRKDAVIEEQARRIQELKEWKKIVTGKGTEQESAVQCWKQKFEQQAQQIARLGNGLACSRSHPHEDMNQICELQTEVARLKNELSRWSWVRFKQLEEENTKLREALRWDGLKVSEENIQWALKELGPAGTRAEAYVQAVVEFAIYMRMVAKQALKEVKE